MSLIKTKEALNLPSPPRGIVEKESKEFRQYCNDNKFDEEDTCPTPSQLQTLLEEKGQLIPQLKKKNVFSGRKERPLSLLLDQVPSPIKNLAELKTDDVELDEKKADDVPAEKWFKGSTLLISGCALAALLSMYLTYRLKN